MEWGIWVRLFVCCGVLLPLVSGGRGGGGVGGGKSTWCIAPQTTISRGSPPFPPPLPPPAVVEARLHEIVVFLYAIFMFMWLPLSSTSVPVFKYFFLRFHETHPLTSLSPVAWKEIVIPQKCLFPPTPILSFFLHFGKREGKNYEGGRRRRKSFFPPSTGDFFFFFFCAKLFCGRRGVVELAKEVLCRTKKDIVLELMAGRSVLEQNRKKSILLFVRAISISSSLPPLLPNQLNPPPLHIPHPRLEFVIS